MAFSRSIQAGKLRQRVDIQQRGPLDANGNPDPEWVTLVANVPAQVAPQAGMQAGPDRTWDPKMGNTQLIPTDTHRVLMRYYPGVDGSMRLLFEGRVLAITSVSDFESRRIFMTLLCQERVGVTS